MLVTSGDAIAEVDSTELGYGCMLFGAATPISAQKS
jgi:hypothetical protein